MVNRMSQLKQLTHYNATGHMICRLFNVRTKADQ